MRITVGQLRRIIKEEVSRTLSEGYSDVAKAGHSIGNNRAFKAAYKKGNISAAASAASSVLRGLGHEEAADWVEANIASDPGFVTAFESQGPYNAGFAVGDAIRNAKVLVDDVAIEYVVQINPGRGTSIGKIQNAHNIVAKPVGVGGDYMVKPAFDSEEEAKSLVSALEADGVEAHFFVNKGRPYWGESK